MDENSQENHLKAYGIAYWVLENNLEVDWLLNYRGGSFLIKNIKEISLECTYRGVSFEILSNNEMSLGLGSTQKIGESLNSYVSNKFEYFKKVKPSNILLRKIFICTRQL